MLLFLLKDDPPASASSLPETGPESRTFLQDGALDETATLLADPCQSGFDAFPDNDHPGSPPDHPAKSLGRRKSFEMANTIRDRDFRVGREDQRKLPSAKVIDPQRSSTQFAVTDSFFLVAGRGRCQQGVCSQALYVLSISSFSLVPCTLKVPSAPVMPAARDHHVVRSRIWRPP